MLIGCAGIISASLIWISCNMKMRSQRSSRVTQMRPDYKDGYINVGLANIEWEKYAEARGPLETALHIHPDDARALYYMALVERRQRHSEAEIADLEKWLRSSRSHAMRGGSWAFPTINSIAATMRCCNSRRSRRLIRTTWPRTTTLRSLPQDGHEKAGVRKKPRCM
jgi:tetratricopeptide (TPR) repeat protein